MAQEQSHVVEIHIGNKFEPLIDFNLPPQIGESRGLVGESQSPRNMPLQPMVPNVNKRKILMLVDPIARDPWILSSDR